MTKVHPATYSKPIVELFQQLLGERTGRVLDPFGGLGDSLRALGGLGWRLCVGNELEMPWCQESTWKGGMVNGDATALPFPDGAFDFIVTSPAYGNRFADHHKPANGEAADARRSYTHDIRRLTEDVDYELHPNNAGLYLFHHPEYRRLHELAWAECTRVTHAGSEVLCNVSNVIKDKAELNVVGWHVDLWRYLGWEVHGAHHVRTRRMRKGANSKARVDGEWVIQLRRAT